MAYAGDRTPQTLPERLSPSRLSDFKQCPAKFFFGTVVKLRSPATEATTVGTLAHEAFELIFDHPRDERTEENAVKYVRPAWEALREKPDYAHLVENAEEIIRIAENAVRSWFNVERPNNFDPVGRELRMTNALGKLELLGIIDRVDRVDVQGEERVYISDYKGLALDTVLPTPQGWTTMGAVQVGDELLTPGGVPTKVLHKSEIHNRPCYAVEFEDGSVIVADNVHLWAVVENGQYEVISTEELARFVRENNGATLPRRRPLELEASGADADAAAAWLCGMSDSGEEEARRLLRGSRAERTLALMRLETAPASDTAEILIIQGLSKDRAAVLCELLCTFSYPFERYDEEDDTVTVEFSTEVVQWRVKSVRSIESVQTQCVEVESPSALYLAGRAMIVCHNTGKVPAIDDRFLDEKFFAMRVYALLWQLEHNEIPHELRLIYVKGGTRDSVRRVRVTPELLEKVKKELKAVHTSMKKSAKAGEFECKKQPLCQWCDYMELCPAWHGELEGLSVGELRVRRNGEGSEVLSD
jgi:RecB family exonuclease